LHPQNNIKIDKGKKPMHSHKPLIKKWQEKENAEDIGSSKVKEIGGPL